MKHLKPFPISEDSNETVSKEDAKEFVREYLKMGTKQNLFHKYLKKNGIGDFEVSSLILEVIEELKKYT